MAESIVMVVESVRTRASTNEALVTFAVPLESADLVATFMGRIGKQVGVAFADIEPEQKQAEPKKVHLFGKKAEILKLSDFFRRPEVWHAIGPPEEYTAWVTRQPSAWSGKFSIPTEGGVNRCDSAYCGDIQGQRVYDYMEIPLTDEELYNLKMKGWLVFNLKDISGHDWAKKERIKHVSRWAWEMVKSHFGAESMADVNPAALREWARSMNVERFLPNGY
jgi:hypothetical protein